MGLRQFGRVRRREVSRRVVLAPVDENLDSRPSVLLRLRRRRRTSPGPATAWWLRRGDSARSAGPARNLTSGAVAWRWGRQKAHAIAEAKRLVVNPKRTHRLSNDERLHRPTETRGRARPRGRRQPRPARRPVCAWAPTASQRSSARSNHRDRLFADTFSHFVCRTSISGRWTGGPSINPWASSTPGKA
jgi:hypothetical protein